MAWAPFSSHRANSSGNSIHLYFYANVQSYAQVSSAFVFLKFLFSQQEGEIARDKPKKWAWLWNVFWSRLTCAVYATNPRQIRIVLNNGGNVRFFLCMIFKSVETATAAVVMVMVTKCDSMHINFSGNISSFVRHDSRRDRWCVWRHNERFGLNSKIPWKNKQNDITRRSRQTCVSEAWKRAYNWYRHLDIS